MDKTPLWSLVVDAISKTVTVLAILIGGMIGYVRYLRGRITHAKLDLDVNVELCEVLGRDALKIAASIQNAGTCRVAFPAGTMQEIQVAVCYPTPWGRACESLTAPKWNVILNEPFPARKDSEDKAVEPREPGVPEDEGLSELEPGQRHFRQVLLPGQAEPTPVGYRVRLYVQGRPRYLYRLRDHPAWSTERVIEVNHRG